MTMEGFVGRRRIFGRSSDVVDTDRPSPPAPRHFGQSTTVPRVAAAVGLESPNANAMAASDTPSSATPGDDTPGLTGRKRKSVGADNLVNFVKDFNHDYLVRVEAQDIEKRTWRSDALAFDTAREARIAHKELQAAGMDQKYYELEVERTKNLGSMTSVLLMLATSMAILTRKIFCTTLVIDLPPHVAHLPPWTPVWLAF